MLEGADCSLVDRVLAVDDHAVLPREQPEAEGVVSPADDPVVVEVESAGDAGVGGGGEEVREVDGGRAVLRDTEVVVTEKRCGETVLDGVELVDEDDVRVGPLDELGDDPGLGVPRRAQVTDQIAAALRFRLALKVAMRTVRSTAEGGLAAYAGEVMAIIVPVVAAPSAPVTKWRRVRSFMVLDGMPRARRCERTMHVTFPKISYAACSPRGPSRR